MHEHVSRHVDVFCAIEEGRGSLEDACADGLWTRGLYLGTSGERTRLRLTANVRCQVTRNTGYRNCIALYRWLL